MVKKSEQQYDFALIIGGVPELTTAVENALFSAGCDDATLSLQHGRIYAEFTRAARSLKDAIISAIRDVRKADLGGEVLRVDECNLVTPSEIARRIKRSRQLVFQYINGQRGPGGFPPPECHLTEGAPLWSWCAVSHWLAQNAFISPEEDWNATVIDAINNFLDSAQQRARNPQLVEEITHGLVVP